MTLQADQKSSEEITPNSRILTEYTPKAACHWQGYFKDSLYISSRRFIY